MNSISEIFDSIERVKTKKTKIKRIQDNANCFPFATVLQGSFNDSINLKLFIPYKNIK